MIRRLNETVAAIRAELGAGAVLTGDQVGARHDADWSGMPARRPEAVVRPRSTEDAAAAVKICAAHGQPIAIQGGMTGLVGGAIVQPGELAISTELLSVIEPVDWVGRTIRAGAGATLQAVQDTCEHAGLTFPLDLGSRGSATIGGIVATNAGGNRVLRYGMARQLVLGVEAVLADGSVLRATHTMLKNNSGYDLKQLLLGSEGTLGLVTGAVLRLWPLAERRQVAFCRVPDFAAVDRVFHDLERATGGLSAFEVMWPDFYTFVLKHGGVARAPFPPGPGGLYVLAEQLGGHPDLLQDAVAVAIEAGLVEDAVVAQSEADARDLWAVRDAIGPASRALAPFVSYDIGLAHSEIARFVAKVLDSTESLGLDEPPLAFGHVGDGNIHVMLGLGNQAETLRPRCDALVYGLTAELGGTISAEHGVGMLKRPWLGYTRAPVDIAMMRSIKGALDPDMLFNPDRIFARG